MQGVNKPWEQHQLSTFRPPTSIYETKSKMSDTSSGVWASNVSRGRAEPHRRVEPSRHMARDSEDGDSVFDDGRGLGLFLIVLFFVFSRIVCASI